MEKRPDERDKTDTFSLAGENAPPFTFDVQPEQAPPPAWLTNVRADLPEAGKFVVFEESGKQLVSAISGEWTRIGRSLSADIRFDDTTVSRRHALIVSQADGVRILDDRSLNGVYVNGIRVEWSELHDGDEITIGRHRLYFLDPTMTESASSQPQSTSS